MGRLYAPVTGEVIEVNDALEDDPTLINSDPYGEGWILRIRAEDKGQLENLKRVTSPDFAPWFLAEVERIAQGKG